MILSILLFSVGVRNVWQSSTFALSDLLARTKTFLIKISNELLNYFFLLIGKQHLNKKVLIIKVLN